MWNDLIGGMHFIVDKLDNMAIISATLCTSTMTHRLIRFNADICVEDFK